MDIIKSSPMSGFLSLTATFFLSMGVSDIAKGLTVFAWVPAWTAVMVAGWIRDKRLSTLPRGGAFDAEWEALLEQETK